MLSCEKLLTFSKNYGTMMVRRPTPSPTPTISEDIHMADMIFDKAAGLWRADKVDFGAGSISLRIRFAHSGNTTLGYVKADGKDIGVVALTSYDNEDTEARCEIDPTAGVHDVTVTLRGNARLLSLEPSAEPVYAGITYEPIPEKATLDLGYDTWEATDMLGRKVASVEDVGKKKDKQVGIFYWTWHEGHADLRPVDVVDVLSKYPAAEYRKDHPAWGERPFQPYWHEPFYGFYRDSDPYIIRHHAALLSAAGVDFLLFDCTNGALTWRSAYEPLFKGLREAKADGIKVPKVAFMLNFGPQETTERMLRSLYQNVYKPGLYSDLWYMLDGKPMIMGYPDALPAEGTCEADTRILNEIREFFTFRPGQPGYGCGPWNNQQWGWLEVYPQHKYVTRPDGGCEMVTVGVGQNANKDRICTHFNDVKTFGRSYTGKYGHSLLTADSYTYGYNVQEQWERALDLDPDIVFVTGWNEWIMGQWHEPWLSDNDSTQLAMVDQYDREHSRDIEMDKDGYLDTYYLQLAHNIRRFKGASPRQAVSPAGIVDLKSGNRDWNTVTPVYRNPKGTTIHRDWDGFGDCHYVNTTGRNDIIEARVARDEENLYFRVKCAQPITPREGEGWMTLFLDTDRSKTTGWEGYDFVINRLPGKKNQASVEKYVPTVEAGSFTWETIGTATYRLSGDTLTIALPRALVGLDQRLDFEFKWSDNMQEPSVMDFYANGDTAPIGRFNYLYRVRHHGYGSH